MKDNDSDLCIKWVEEFIIGQNICPFAKQPYNSNLIRFHYDHSITDDDLSKTFESEVMLLKEKTSTRISNTLLFFPKLKNSFLSMLNLCELFESFIQPNDFTLIVFHPDFKFEDSDEQDRINIVNRSPFPMVHILRTDELKSAANSEQGLNVNRANEKKIKGWTEQEYREHLSTYNL